MKTGTARKESPGGLSEYNFPSISAKSGVNQYSSRYSTGNQKTPLSAIDFVNKKRDVGLGPCNVRGIDIP
jgi:hypothetical protein